MSHSDQASTLRRLMQQRNSVKGERGPATPAKAGPKVVTLASGKGGVGKTCLAANLGTQLARMGHRVLLIDGDMGLANLDIVLGVQPGSTLEQVLDGSVSVQEAIVGVEPNLWLIPAAAGLLELRQADAATRARLIQTLDTLPYDMDFVLIDAGAGIQSNVLSLHSPGFHSVVVLTPEPTSLTDGYGLIKILRRQAGITDASVIVNRVTDGREGLQTFQKLQGVAQRFVDVELQYLGHWERDEKIGQAVMKRKTLLDLDTRALSIPSLELLAKRFRTQVLGVSDDKLTPGSRATRGPSPLRTAATGRFMDEPARTAPANTAGFFRTLLGEVKA